MIRSIIIYTRFMHVTKYRYTILTIIIWTLWVGVFVWIFPQIQPLWEKAIRLMNTLYHASIGDGKIDTNSILTPVLIHNIITERYLFTLTKYIENQLTNTRQMSIMLPSDYQTYNNVCISGDNFIFTIHHLTITIPTSSYFFDRWNTKPAATISGEISIGTGEIEKNHKKIIALTFDDGPSPKYTDILLDILKKENIRATFYVLWSRIMEYPEILKREYNEWHEIGNHSYSHTLLTKLNERMMEEELYTTDQLIYQTIWIYPRTFRPPYWGVNTVILNKAAMPAVLWSIDPHDWKTHSKIRNIASINNAKDGDILIMHDIHETSVNSVLEIINTLKEKWFTFVTITELLSLSERNTEIWKKCTKKGSCK